MTTQPGREFCKSGYVIILYYCRLKVSAYGNKMKWKYCLNDDLQVLFIKRLRFDQSDFFTSHHLNTCLVVLPSLRTMNIPCAGVDTRSPVSLKYSVR